MACFHIIKTLPLSKLREWLPLSWRSRIRCSGLLLDNMAEAKPRKITPRSATVDTLQTESARVYTHIHPILLLSFHAIRFDALVADPVTTLLGSLLPIALLQISYVIVCLPPWRGARAVEPPTVPSKDVKALSHRKKNSTGKAPAPVDRKLIVIRPSSRSQIGRLIQLVASSAFPVTLYFPWSTGPLDHPRSFWGSLWDPSISHPSLCGSHVSVGDPAIGLRTRSRCADVEGNRLSISAFRRSLGSYGWGVHWRMAWSYSYTFGLVRASSTLSCWFH